jgi:hypothetical protein
MDVRAYREKPIHKELQRSAIASASRWPATLGPAPTTGTCMCATATARCDTVVPHTAAQFGRAIIMPNLKPPVTTAAQALAYRERIRAAVPQGGRSSR